MALGLIIWILFFIGTSRYWNWKLTSLTLSRVGLPRAKFCFSALCGYDLAMRYTLRFMWNATRGHRLTPWRSPYLLWRIETYCGVKMHQIGFLEFWEFLWRERVNLVAISEVDF